MNTQRHNRPAAVSGVGLLVLSSTVFAQAPDVTPIPQVQRQCGTELTPESIARMRELQAAGHYAPPPRPRGGEAVIVPLTFHVVRQSDGTGGLPEANLVACIADANSHYAAAGLRFVRPLPTRFIDSDLFYFNVDSDAECDALRQVDVVCGTINVYFTQNLADDDGTLCGKASFPFNGVQGILMANGCTGTAGNSNGVFSHELGHYFSLLHTHETSLGAECVDGSNCDVAGDVICDTPADPTLSGSNMDMFCNYIGTMVDSCNGDPYSPQTWNLMSYATPASCLTAFTVTQSAVIAATAESIRLPQWSPAACGCGLLVWVDSNYNEPFQVGSQTQPFEVLADGLDAACSGGMVFLRTGVYHATVINQRVTLNASGGIARIGL